MTWLAQTIRRVWPLAVSALGSVALIALDYPDHLTGGTLIAAIGLGASLMGMALDPLHSSSQRQVDALLRLVESLLKALWQQTKKQK